MYEGVSFVPEGAETGDMIVGLGAKDFREGFDNAHEGVFARDRWCLMPEVYG